VSKVPREKKQESPGPPRSSGEENSQRGLVSRRGGGGGTSSKGPTNTPGMKLCIFFGGKDQLGPGKFGWPMGLKPTRQVSVKNYPAEGRSSAPRKKQQTKFAKLPTRGKSKKYKPKVAKTKPRVQHLVLKGRRAEKTNHQFIRKVPSRLEKVSRREGENTSRGGGKSAGRSRGTKAVKDATPQFDQTSRRSGKANQKKKGGHRKTPGDRKVPAGPSRVSDDPGQEEKAGAEKGGGRNAKSRKNSPTDGRGARTKGFNTVLKEGRRANPMSGGKEWRHRKISLFADIKGGNPPRILGHQKGGKKDSAKSRESGGIENKKKTGGKHRGWARIVKSGTASELRRGP